jgi:S1-C subfamily serine protease
MLSAPSARSELSDTVERVRPSIVIVGTYHKTGSPQFVLRGTGFVVRGGRVVTNAHVVSAARSGPEGSSIVVRQALADRDDAGQIRATSLEASDPIHDLAILRVEGPELPALDLGDSDAVREGHSVAFTGFPIGSALGFTPVTHRGIVSALTSIAPPSQSAQGLNEKLVRAIKAGSFQVFQLDATAYPGNSGGPMFDPETGKVLGIINMVFVKGPKESALSHPSGISYAIPANKLRELLRALK